MKYIRQLLIILGISFAGEVLKYMLPLPIPAGLMTGLIKLEAVRETGKFLIEIMPLMFIPAGVGLMNSWGKLASVLVPVCIITAVTIITVMIATGRMSQWIIRKSRNKETDRDE